MMHFKIIQATISLYRMRIQCQIRYKKHSKAWELPVMLNEAKTSRLRPELRGRGQILEVEAKAEAKNNYEKSTK